MLSIRVSKFARTSSGSFRQRLMWEISCSVRTAVPSFAFFSLISEFPIR
ncbi:MAG: hypothetical protein K2K44_00730 [Oscillospiraceae bacterium]|nr:hypothetical protein [Oscillospiraceae bacterium]